jgi:hypothetical protein
LLITSGKNLVVWGKPLDLGIASYNIYWETSVISQYELIGNIPYNQMSVFIDSTSVPEARQYLYKITVVDSCGNESEKSPYHKTLLLQYVGSYNGVNLSWSDYEIEGGDNGFVTYEIYRGEDSSSMEKIREISASLHVFTDIYPEALTKKFYYRIAGVKAEQCYPTGTRKGSNIDYGRSFSNLEDNQLLSAQDIRSLDQLIVYPNPFNESTTFIFSNPEGYPYKLYLMDLSGKVCRIVNDINTSRYILEKKELQAGFYFLELRGPDILRGTIIIQ